VIVDAAKIMKKMHYESVKTAKKCTFGVQFSQKSSENDDFFTLLTNCYFLLAG